MAWVTIFIASGSSFTRPSDWKNSNNIVDCIGGGGESAIYYNSGTPWYGAWSGGGGAWAIKTNITLSSSSVIIHVGNSTSADNDTWFNGASFAASSVGAKGGKDADTGLGDYEILGGQASECIGDNAYSGGAGHYYASSANGHNCGGGGAAGPHGAGGDGQVTGGYGGSALGGTGDGGYTAAGDDGTQYDATHGSGGGGPAYPGVSPVGGLYGGGAGARCQYASYASGVGTSGLIVVAYERNAPGITAQILG